MNATLNLTNRTINGLKVLQRVSLSAANPRYLCRCERCHSESTWDHNRLINAMNGYHGQVAQCLLANCRLGQAGLKPNKITELDASTGMGAVPMEQGRSSAVPAIPKVVKRIKSKDELEFERICLSRAYYELDPLTQSQVELVKRYQPKIFNKILATVECYENLTTNGGNI